MDKKEYKRQYYLKNRERLLKKQKDYASNNADKLIEYRKTDSYQKSMLLCNWKAIGLVGDYEMIHKRYMNTCNCDICSVKLTSDKKTTSTRKSMDHDHKSGEFRNILCHKCNMTRKERYKNNTTGHKGLVLTNDGGRVRWRYGSRRFKNKTDALCYKFYILIKGVN